MMIILLLCEGVHGSIIPSVVAQLIEEKKKLVSVSAVLVFELFLPRIPSPLLFFCKGLVSKSLLFLSLELCPQSVADALQEMTLAYRQQSKVIPLG